MSRPLAQLRICVRCRWLDGAGGERWTYSAERGK